MRREIKIQNRFSKPVHFSLNPLDLKKGQVVILVDVGSDKSHISILCRFVSFYKSKITVMVSDDLIYYLFGACDVLSSDGTEFITLDVRDVWIHQCENG